MKNFRNYLLVLCMSSVAISITACLGDDDEQKTSQTVMTQAEKTAAIQAVKGSYSGKLYYYNPAASTAAFVDSTNVSWTITENDSVFVTNNIPLSIFANYVDDMNHKNILQAAGNGRFQTVLHPTDKDNVDSYTYYVFALQTNNSMTGTIEYGGQHTITVNFANSIEVNDPNGAPRYYMPYADCWRNMYTMRLYINTISVDGVTYNILNSSKVKTFTFSGRK